MSESQIQIYNSYLFTYYNNLAIIYSELKKFIGADGYGIYKVVHSGSYVEIQEDKITIYKDYVNISFDDNFNYRIVELPSGRVLNYGNNFNNPKIDISFLNHGAYLIEIISGSNFFYKKFIK